MRCLSLWWCAAVLSFLLTACPDDPPADDPDTQSADIGAGDATDTSSEPDTGTDTGAADTNAPDTGCRISSDCTGSTPVCLVSTGDCVECTTNTNCVGNLNGGTCDPNTHTCAVPKEACAPDNLGFDCTQPTAPACIANAQDATTGICGTFDGCTSDDEHEPNDGPAAATDITPTGSDTRTLSAQLCSAPEVFQETDWFVFTAGEGDHYTLSVSNSTGADLDIDVYDAGGTNLGFSWWRDPEVIELSYLPGGNYYIVVTRYTDTPDAAPIDYDVTVDRTTGQTCATAADCAQSFTTQYFRGDCTAAGGCAFIDGLSSVADGELCDSDNDCASGSCTYAAFDTFQVGTAADDRILLAFISNADTQSFCTGPCTDDSACAAVKVDSVCSTGYEDTLGNFCRAKCTSGSDCSALLFSTPRDGDAWFHRTCEVATGNCIELTPAVTVIDQSVGDNAGQQTVSIATVDSDGPGLLVVHKEGTPSGSIGAPIGWAPVVSGYNTDVVVGTLSETVADGALLFAMLHTDGNNDGAYTDNNDDPPVLDGSGQVIAPSFTVTVPAPLMWSQVWSSGEVGASFALDLADYDGDSNLDLAVGGHHTGSTSDVQPADRVYKGNGDGTFTLAWTSTHDHHSRGIAWINEDGDADLDLFTTQGKTNQNATILINDGSNNWDTLSAWSSSTAWAKDVELADVTGDAVLDAVVVLDYQSNKGILVLVGDGTGSFTEGWFLDLTACGCQEIYTDIELADVDGTNGLDIVVTQTNMAAQGPARVFLNDGSGTFTESWNSGAGRYNFIAVLDTNNDTFLDLVLDTAVYTGDGAGNFAVGPPLSITGILAGLEAADVNGDGKAELLVVTRTPEQLYIVDVSTGTPATTIVPFTLSGSASGFPEAGIRVGNLDADPEVEIIIGVARDPNGELLTLDLQ